MESMQCISHHMVDRFGKAPTEDKRFYAYFKMAATYHCQLVTSIHPSEASFLVVGECVQYKLNTGSQWDHQVSHHSRLKWHFLIYCLFTFHSRVCSTLGSASPSH